MSFDGEAQETRRNRTIAIGVSVAAVVMVGLLFWIFNSLSGPDLAVAPAAVTTTGPTGTTTEAATTPSETTSTGPPTIATWTPSTTFSLPPPEQPTETVAVETPAAAQPSAPPPTQAAPPPPAKPGISNVNLTCSKSDNRRVTARLTFTTTDKVDVILSAGGGIDRKSAGPGDVSMTTNGRGAEICFGRVGDQQVGPVPAS
jgi:cytoskeletal protein RodZ